MFHNFFVRVTTGAFLLTGGLMLVACSSSDRQASPGADRSGAATTAETAPPPEQSTAPGMKVFIDPVTGEVRDPTDAEHATMERQSSSKSETSPATSTEQKQREVKLRKRGTAIMMDGNPETPLQACTNADGSVVVDHDCETTQSKQDPKGGKP